MKHSLLLSTLLTVIVLPAYGVVFSNESHHEICIISLNGTTPIFPLIDINKKPHEIDCTVCFIRRTGLKRANGKREMVIYRLKGLTPNTTIVFKPNRIVDIQNAKDEADVIMTEADSWYEDDVV